MKFFVLLSFITSLAFAQTRDNYINGDCLRFSNTGVCIDKDEFESLNDIESNIQDQLDGKAPDADLTTLEGRVDTTESDIESIQGDYIVLESGLEDVVEDIDALDTRVGTTESDIESLQNDSVVGPASSVTDNAVPRFDTTTGRLLQDSNVIINDTDDITGVNSLLSSGNITSQDGNLEGENLVEETESDGSTTGANAFLPSGTGIVRLTNSSLTSIAAIDDTTSGRSKTIINGTGSTIQIVNNGGPTADGYKILTGTDGDISVDNNASILVKYNPGSSRWMVVGGTGSGGGGSNSILANTEFEQGATGWTSTTVTPTSEDAELPGKKMLCFTASSQAFTLYQDSTIGQAGFVNGVNGKASIRLKTDHDAAITVCPRKAGVATDDCITLDAIQRNDAWHFYEIPFVLGGTSNGIIVSAASGSGTTCADNASVEMSKGFNSVSNVKITKNFTPTITGFGTVSNSYMEITQNGDKALVYVTFVSGTPTSVVGTIALPSGYTMKATTGAEQYVGQWLRGGITNNESTSGAILRNTSAGNLLYFANPVSKSGTAGDPYSSPNADTLAVSGNTIIVRAEVTLAGQEATINTYSSNAPSKIKFEAYRSSDQTGVNPNGSAVKVNWNAETEDTSSSFDTSNGRFTAGPGQGGEYHFISCVGLNSTNVLNERYSLLFYKNGASHKAGESYFNSSAGNAMRICSSTRMTLADNDYVEVYLFGVGDNSSNTLSIGSSSILTYFQGYREFDPAFITASFKDITKTPGITSPKECIVMNGGATNADACSSNPCTEHFDSCQQASPAARSAAGTYSLVFANGTFAPSTYISCWASQSGASVDYLAAPATTTSSGGLTVSYKTFDTSAVTSGTGQDRYFTIGCKGFSP